MNIKVVLDKELFDFMVQNGIYPMCSKNGKIFLKCTRKGILSEEKKTEIIKRLNIKTPEDCKALREAIKKEVANRRITLPIKDWIEDERPREMLAKLGAENLALSKLLAIILRTGKEGMSAEDLAKVLLNHFGSLRAIDSATFTDLSKIEGIGFTKAVQVKAALELGKRFYRESKSKEEIEETR